MSGCNFGDGNRVLDVRFSVLDREGYRRFVVLGMCGGVTWGWIYGVKAKAMESALNPERLWQSLALPFAKVISKVRDGVLAVAYQL